jgi:Flp pilus assembly protein TadG
MLMSPRRGEEGSTVVEMVIVAVAVFSLLIGMLAFALAEASDNAGANAASEGARAAILNTMCADAYRASTTDNGAACPTIPSPAYTSIVQAVTKKLGGLVVGTPTVAVTCLWGSSSPPANPLDTKPCDASVVPDVDLIRVSVTWTRVAANPMAATTTRTDSATLTLENSGAGSSDTSACLANATVSPNTVAIAGSTAPGYLAPGTQATVTVTTNGLCATPLTIGFNTGVINPAVQMTPLPNGSDFTFTINANDYQWSPGTYLFVVTDLKGSPITFVVQPQITVTGPQCQYVSASLNPGSVVISGTSSPGALSQSVLLTLTTTSGCLGISAQFNPGGSAAQSLEMGGAAPNYYLALPPALLWSTGLKPFTFTDEGGGNIPLRSEQSLNLNVSLVCGLSTVTVSPDPVKHTGQSLKSNVTVTGTPATGADCSGLSLTYNYSGGSTTVAMVLQSSGVYQYVIPSSADIWSVGTFSMTLASTDNPAVGTSPNPVTLTVN